MNDNRGSPIGHRGSPVGRRHSDDSNAFINADAAFINADDDATSSNNGIQMADWYDSRPTNPSRSSPQLLSVVPADHLKTSAASSVNASVSDADIASLEDHRYYGGNGAYISGSNDTSATDYDDVSTDSGEVSRAKNLIVVDGVRKRIIDVQRDFPTRGAFVPPPAEIASSSSSSSPGNGAVLIHALSHDQAIRTLRSVDVSQIDASTKANAVYESTPAKVPVDEKASKLDLVNPSPRQFSPSHRVTILSGQTPPSRGVTLNEEGESQRVTENPVGESHRESTAIANFEGSLFKSGQVTIRDGPSIRNQGHSSTDLTLLSQPQYVFADTLDNNISSISLVEGKSKNLPVYSTVDAKHPAEPAMDTSNLSTALVPKLPKLSSVQITELPNQSTTAQAKNPSTESAVEVTYLPNQSTAQTKMLSTQSFNAVSESVHWNLDSRHVTLSDGERVSFDSFKDESAKEGEASAQVKTLRGE